MVFLEGFVLWTVMSTMHSYVEHLGGTPKMLGLLFALMSLPKLFTNPILGRLSDRVGRRPVLIISGFGTIAASILWAEANSLFVLTLSRIIAGCAGIQAALSQSIVADLTPPQGRTVGMGWIGAAFGLSILIGPIAGSHIADTFGVQTIGWWAAGAQVISLLLIIFALPETLPPEKRAQNQASTALRDAAITDAPRQKLIAIPGVMLILVCVGLLMAANGQLTTTLGRVMEDVYHWSLDNIGYTYASIGVIGVVVQGGVLRVLLKRMSTQSVAIIGGYALALGSVVLATSSNMTLFWLGMASFGVGLALLQPTTSALLSSRIPPEYQGRMLGMYQGITSGGRSVGAALAGGLYGITFRAPYIAAALFAVSVIGMLFNLPAVGSHPASSEEDPPTPEVASESVPD